MTVIADSSSLIALATVDAMWVLPNLFPRVTIPDAVYDEVVKKGEGLPGSEEVASAKWIERVTVRSPDRVQSYRSQRLGVGESEVLALAEELKADIVLVDDERVWEIARSIGISYLRSIEVILEASRREVLDKETARAKLVLLHEKRWISEDVIQQALLQLEEQH
jgi:predicted nucleic acid-binding protein